MNEILIKIKAIFSGKGAEEAQAAMQATKAKAQEMGAATRQAAQEGGAALNIMETAGAAMSGNFEGVASAAVRLLGKIKALNMSLLELSLFAAALTGIVKVISMFRDAAAKASDALEKTRFDVFAQQVKLSADAFNQLMAATDRQAAGADAQLAYQNALIDAHKREALALNEVSKQRALAEADTEDARGVVEQKFARTAQAITAGFDDKKSAAERKRLEDMTEEISSKIDELERRRVDLEGKSEVERQKIAPNEEKAEKDSRFWRPLNTAFQADPEKYRKRAEESQKLADDLKQEAAKAHEAIIALQTQLRDVMRQINLTDVNKQATGAERAAEAATVDTAQTDLYRKREAERVAADAKRAEGSDAGVAAMEAQRQYNEAVAKGAEVDAQVSGARGNLMGAREAYNADAADDGNVSEENARKLEDARKKMAEATAAQAQYHEAVGRFMEAMKRQAETAAEKANNLRDTIS